MTTKETDPLDKLGPNDFITMQDIIPIPKSSYRKNFPVYQALMIKHFIVLAHQIVKEVKTQTNVREYLKLRLKEIKVIFHRMTPRAEFKKRGNQILTDEHINKLVSARKLAKESRKEEFNLLYSEYQTLGLTVEHILSNFLGTKLYFDKILNGTAVPSRNFLNRLKELIDQRKEEIGKE